MGRWPRRPPPPRPALPASQELFLALVIDLSFFSGLCAAGKAVAAALEHMAGDAQQLTDMQKAAEAAEVRPGRHGPGRVGITVLLQVTNGGFCCEDVCVCV